MAFSASTVIAVESCRILLTTRQKSITKCKEVCAEGNVSASPSRLLGGRGRTAQAGISQITRNRFDSGRPLQSFKKCAWMQLRSYEVYSNRGFYN